MNIRILTLLVLSLLTASAQATVDCSVSSCLGPAREVITGMRNLGAAVRLELASAAQGALQCTSADALGGGPKKALIAASHVDFKEMWSMILTAYSLNSRLWLLFNNSGTCTVATVEMRSL